LAPDPPGEYAQSCFGRERMFEYFSKQFSTPGRLFRLNYAIDMRYGVLHDIATKVLQGTPIDVSLGHVNFIWQGDASAQALRCLAHCETPTSPINVSGPEILAVRDLAAKFGQRFGRAPIIVGQEQPTAWLTDTSLAVKLFGLRDGRQLVATAALLPYSAGNAWISMVLVTASWRRRGVATRLVDACVEAARKRGLTTWLDATPDGATVYGPLGFTPTLQLRR